MLQPQILQQENTGLGPKITIIWIRSFPFPPYLPSYHAKASTFIRISFLNPSKYTFFSLLIVSEHSLEISTSNALLRDVILPNISRSGSAGIEPRRRYSAPRARCIHLDTRKRDPLWGHNAGWKSETRMAAYGFAPACSEGEVRTVWKWWKSFLRHCQPPPVRITLPCRPPPFLPHNLVFPPSSPCTEELGAPLYPS